MKPKITLVMPIYNTGEQLYKTLFSVLQQTEKDFELLMVDDCSDDALTIETEETFCNFDHRCQLIKMEQNCGSGPCRNRGLESAHGEFIMFLDSDDIFLPNMLQEMYETLKKHMDADICICNFVMQDIQSGEESFIQAKKKDGVTNHVFTMDEVGEGGLSYWMPTPWNRMLRTEYVLRANLTFQNLTNCSDMFFGYASVLNARGITYCNNSDPLVIYRVNNPEQISYHMDPMNMICAFRKLLEFDQEFFSLRPGCMRQVMCALLDTIEPMLSRSPDVERNRRCIEAAADILHQYTTEKYFEDEKHNWKRNQIIHLCE